MFSLDLVASHLGSVLSENSLSHALNDDMIYIWSMLYLNKQTLKKLIIFEANSSIYKKPENWIYKGIPIGTNSTKKAHFTF